LKFNDELIKFIEDKSIVEAFKPAAEELVA
jgi:hypothetical protein